jgi:hypothetical protein
MSFVVAALLQRTAGIIAKEHAENVSRTVHEFLVLELKLDLILDVLPAAGNLAAQLLCLRGLTGLVARLALLLPPCCESVHGTISSIKIRSIFLIDTLHAKTKRFPNLWAGERTPDVRYRLLLKQIAAKLLCETIEQLGHILAKLCSHISNAMELLICGFWNLVAAHLLWSFCNTIVVSCYPALRKEHLFLFQQVFYDLLAASMTYPDEFTIIIRGSSTWNTGREPPEKVASTHGHIQQITHLR